MILNTGVYIHLLILYALYSFLKYIIRSCSLIGCSRQTISLGEGGDNAAAGCGIGYSMKYLIDKHHVAMPVAMLHHRVISWKWLPVGCFL